MTSTTKKKSVLGNTQRAFFSLLSPKSWPVMLAALGASAAVVFVLWAACSWLIGWLVKGVISWDWVTNWLQATTALALVWGLFPLLIPLFISMFVNKLAALIESKEYSDAPQGQNLPLFPELRMDIGFVLYAIGINILLLPFYLIPGLNLIIYYLLNAHLLGKQYFMMVSRRHFPKEEMKQFSYKHRSVIYIYGLIIVFFSTIPGINLVAPAFATALMVHVFFCLPKPQPVTNA